MQWYKEDRLWSVVIPLIFSLQYIMFMLSIFYRVEVTPTKLQFSSVKLFQSWLANEKEKPWEVFPCNKNPFFVQCFCKNVIRKPLSFDNFVRQNKDAWKSITSHTICTGIYTRVLLNAFWLFMSLIPTSTAFLFLKHYEW